MRVERAVGELAPAKRYDAALQAARDRLVALGGNDGYATFFSFGHSLRG